MTGQYISSKFLTYDSRLQVQNLNRTLFITRDHNLLSHPGLHFILNKKETLTTKLKENENDREKLNSPINIFTKVEKNLIQALYL